MLFFFYIFLILIFNQYKSSPNCFCILKITTGRGSRCGCRLDISLSASLLWLSNSICLDTRLHRARSMDPLRVYARCGSLWHCCFFLTRASDWWQTSDSVVTCKICFLFVFFNTEKKKTNTAGWSGLRWDFCALCLWRIPTVFGLISFQEQDKISCLYFFCLSNLCGFPPLDHGRLRVSRQAKFLSCKCCFYLAQV